MNKKEEIKKIIFTWDIHLACSYRCPYCWFHGNWDNLKENNKYLKPDEMIKYWKRIYDKYGKVMITVAGGEPLTYPGFDEVFEKLSHLHDIEITSNISISITVLDAFLKKVKGRHIKISATYHPLFADLEEFIEKAILLREYDMLGGILYLAYPPQIKYIPELMERFKKESLHFSVLTFWGDFEGKEYPASYTDEEKKIIGLGIGSRSGEEFRTAPKRTFGQLCNAGHTYAVIHPDGEALRCGGGGVKGENIAIGNIFDENFKLLDEASPCHSEVCPCNEWAFLLDNKEEDTD